MKTRASKSLLLASLVCLSAPAWSQQAVTATASLARHVPLDEMATLADSLQADGGTVTYITHSTKHGGGGAWLTLGKTWEANLAEFERSIKALGIPQVTPTVTDLKLYGLQENLDQIAAKYPGTIHMITTDEPTEPQENIDTTYPFEGTAARLGNGVPNLENP